MKDGVRWFLDGLPPEVRDIVATPRAVVRRAVPQAEESVVGGSLSYRRPKVGGRVKGAVCQIVVKGDRVRLEFIHEVRLADPSGLLRGERVTPARWVPRRRRRPCRPSALHRPYTG